LALRARSFACGALSALRVECDPLRFGPLFALTHRGEPSLLDRAPLVFERHQAGCLFRFLGCRRFGARPLDDQPFLVERRLARGAIGSALEFFFCAARRFDFVARLRCVCLRQRLGLGASLLFGCCLLGGGFRGLSLRLGGRARLRLLLLFLHRGLR
jgi:hypothetical protein